MPTTSPPAEVVGKPRRNIVTLAERAERTEPRALVTIPAIMRRWCCSRSTVYAHIRDGRLTRVKIGRASRVPLAEVEAVERGNGRPPAPGAA